VVHALVLNHAVWVGLEGHAVASRGEEGKLLLEDGSGHDLVPLPRHPTGIHTILPLELDVQPAVHLIRCPVSKLVEGILENAVPSHVNTEGSVVVVVTALGNPGSEVGALVLKLNQPGVLQEDLEILLQAGRIVPNQRVHKERMLLRKHQEVELLSVRCCNDLRRIRRICCCSLLSDRAQNCKRFHKGEIGQNALRCNGGFALLWSNLLQHAFEANGMLGKRLPQDLGSLLEGHEALVLLQLEFLGKAFHCAEAINIRRHL
jgi:hypothetical protein